MTQDILTRHLLKKCGEVLSLSALLQIVEVGCLSHVLYQQDYEVLDFIFDISGRNSPSIAQMWLYSGEK